MPHDSGDTAKPFSLPPLGISTCRLRGFPQPYAAVEAAGAVGIQLFATFPALDDGFSESAVGEWSSHQGRSPEVVVFLGLLEGVLYHRAVERAREAHPYPELLHLHDGLAYCLHPRFVQEQLEASRQRLHRDRLSGVLLQRPELFLQWAAQHSIPPDEAQHELLRRLEQAFAFLEQECRQGRLNAYGLQLESPSSLPIAELFELATTVGTLSHHCRLLAVPFNLFEPEAATEPIADGHTLLEYAASYGIHVLVYRPLNARFRGRPILLAEPPVEKPALVSVEHIRGQLREFIHTETDVLRLLMEQPLDGAYRDIVRESLTLSLFLHDHWHEFASYEDWMALQEGYLSDRFRSLRAFLEPLLTTDALVQQWNAYTERFHQVLTDIGRLYAARAYDRARRLREFIHDALGYSLPPVSFAQLALALVRHTTGVGSVLLSSTSADHLAEFAAVERLAMPSLGRQEWLRLREAHTILQHGF